MAVDAFFKRPYRGSKASGTKCTKCEVVNGCSDGGKCVHALVCVALSIEGCASIPTNVDSQTKAVPYDCEAKRFDLSVFCGDYEIDLFLSYEERYGEDHAVLRSETLGIEEWIAFSDGVDARCPNFDFSVATVRPYAMVSLGPQMCLDSGPEDCTAGRCLPRFLCGEVYTASSPDEPLLTTLEWYVNDTVELPESCCCNANTFPEMLIARVVNYSDGCTCIGPKRVGGPYYSAENSGAELSDSGATFHLRHRVASEYDDFLDIVPEGTDVWVSEGPGGDDIVSLCPGVGQVINDDTRYIRGRMLFWCDPASGQFKSHFEMLGDYESVHEIDDVKILRCNPFFAKARGIFEPTNCQNLSSVDGEGILEIVISEFQGWVGPNPEPGREGKQITLYTERTNTAAIPQTIAGDCWPKMHIQQDEQVTFKARDDVFWIDSQWPEGVWNESEYLLFENSPYSQIQRIVVRPKPCTGCEVVVDDPYGEVQTDCCGNTLPRTLYVSAVNQNDCPCAEGTEIVLTYDDDERSWIGSSQFGAYCGCTVRMKLTCRTVIASGVWDLFIYFNDSLTAFWTQGDPSDRAFACDPFLWITRSMSNNECCDPVYAASDFYWVITE